MSKLLLSNGTVILLGAGDKISVTKTDVLIQDSNIVKIELCISPEKDCEIIDCTDKIISPGFIDTHRHLWETALKGVCEDLTGPDYFATMFSASFTFTPEDVFWGSLAGCVEAIDAGTTTVLDYAHGNWTEEHGMQSIASTLSSGIRSITVMAPAVTLTQTSPEIVVGDLIPNWFVPSLERISLLQPLASKSSRVRLGLGFDYFFLPKEVVVGTFHEARSLGIDIITSHCARLKGETGDSVPQLLKSYGLLDNHLVLSHAGGTTEDDARLFKEAGTFIAASPSVESTMGLGPPNCFRLDRPGLDSVCSLGIDCHCVTSASMPNEMRVALIAARGIDSANQLSRGSVPRKICRTAHDAFIVGTIQGARALNMEDQIGSIAIGKKADLVIFEMLSPAMTGAAQIDAVNAIVMHSTIADISTVIVDGIVRKRDGKLIASNKVHWDQRGGAFIESSEPLAWSQIAHQVLETQQKFMAKLKELDMDQMRDFVVRFFNM